ncbi:MAG: leucine-rich repeat protein, partial [Opitutae bacterium]|nr:leucine-rich repeat protein [Opitutae bacterium]
LRIISGNEEKIFKNYNIAATALRAGNNVLAAEVHQRGRTSSDLIFDLKVFQTGETVQAPASLAKAITGKRFVCQIDKDQEQSEHSNVLLQFEKDGIFNIAEISEGKISPKDDDLTYTVDGLTARVKKSGEEDGGVTFTSATPKKGDKISFGPEKRQINATILRIEPAAPLVNTPPKQSKIGLGQMLLELEKPLIDQEKLLVGRWQEFDMEDPDTPLSHWIFRADRSYTWFIVHPATDDEGNEIAGKTEGHLNHGIWKIDDNRLNHFDLVYNGEKLEEVEAWISELKSLTRDGYRSEETVEGDTNKFRGLPVEKFTAPEMLPYNDAAAFQSFDIRKTYNSAKGKGTEQINIFFSSTPETSKPINPEPAEDPTKPDPKAEARKPGTVLWEFETGGQVRSSPAIGLDGTVYFGSWDHKIYALLGKTGAKRWEFETGGPVKSSPAIGSDGTVYVGSLNRKVYALDGKTGVKRWEFETERPVYSSPAIGIGGTVYIGSGDKKLYALDGKTGAKRWEFETGEGISSCPSIGIDGTIYFGSDKIYALDGKTGTKIWEWDAARSVQSSSPAIGADGTLYIGLKDNNVYALDGRTGIKRWEFETGRNVVRSSPAIGFDGTVYVGSVDSKVYALNGRTGKKKWEFVTGALVVASPTIGIDETVYIGSSDHKVYALDGRTGAKRWEFVTQEKVSSCPSIGIDGTLYVGSDDHKVYALLTESKGLAKSPWPMRGQNAQHTGRAPKADAFPAIAEVKPTEEALVNPNLKYKIEGDAVTITGCDKKTSGALIIPATIEGKTVTSIGNEALRNCTRLTSITIPDSVTSIGEAAFFMSSNLTSITIGDGVTSIGDYTFSQCHSLTTIEVGAGNVYFTDINGVLFNAEKTVLLTCPAGKKGATYNIPDIVTSIGYEAFSGCTRLTSITIPDSVTSIGEAAFRVCTRLTSIEIPDSVTSIGDFAFKDCTRLTSITIPDSVTSIREAAFSGCTRLTSITIPESVTSIGNEAFKDCTSLTSITIPNKVTSIGGHAFAACTSLTTIEVKARNVNFTEVKGALLNAGKTVLLTYPAGKKGANYTIPDSVTSIEEGAFRGCSSLTNITIPDSVTSIGEKVFYNCTSLNAVTFLGDAPKAGRSSPFFFANPTIYRKPEAKGWGDTFGYRPVKLISEKP